MRKKNYLPLLGFIAPLILNLLPLQLGAFIATLIALLILGLQIDKYQSGNNNFISHLFTGASFALLIKAGFPDLAEPELIIYILLFLSLLINFWHKKDKKELPFKIILLLALSLPLLSSYLHFGSLLIWLPIIAMILAIIAKKAAHYRDLNWLWNENPIFAILLTGGIISTLVYTGVFSPLSLIFSAVIILAIISYIYYSYARKKEQSSTQTAQIEAEKQEKEKKIMETKKKKERDKKEFLDNILAANLEPYRQDLIISNLKKQVIWGPTLNEAINFSKEIVSSSYIDNELEKTISFIDSLLDKIEQEKKASTIYTGENELKHKLLNVKNLLKK